MWIPLVFTGAIFGALEVLSYRSLSRDVFLQSEVVPDWCSLSTGSNEPEQAIPKDKTPLKAFSLRKQATDPKSTPEKWGQRMQFGSPWILKDALVWTDAYFFYPRSCQKTFIWETLQELTKSSSSSVAVGSKWQTLRAHLKNKTKGCEKGSERKSLSSVH